MSKILKNQTGSPVVLQDTGQTVPASGSLTIDPNDYVLYAQSSDVITKVGDSTLVVNDGNEDLSITDGIDLLKGFLSKNPKTADKRDIVAVNRIPPGYTMYPCGEGSHIGNGTFQGGDELLMTATGQEKEFRWKECFYAVGGRAIFDGCARGDYLESWLKAPATAGVNQAGDFDKVPTGLGFNVFVPNATPGAGAWDIDLTEKLNGNVDFTKAVPVPVPGNTGYFNYDPDADALTLVSNPAAPDGGYNLYDAEIPLFKFAHKAWLMPSEVKASNEINLEASDVVGKLLFPHWRIVFKLTTGAVDPWVAIVMSLAVKRNQ